MVSTSLLQLRLNEVTRAIDEYEEGLCLLEGFALIEARTTLSQLYKAQAKLITNITEIRIIEANAKRTDAQ